MRKTSRNKVYKVISGERDYQIATYGQTLSSGRKGDGARTLDEFILYVNALSADLAQCTVKNGKKDHKLAMMRKIAATAVSCMEQHGVDERKW